MQLLESRNNIARSSQSPTHSPDISKNAGLVCERKEEFDEERESSIMAEKLAPEKQHVFMHNGQKVFEWDQTLEEVNFYIDLPPGVNTKQFYCKIQSKHIEVGIKGNPPYMNHDLAAPVKTDSSFWTIGETFLARLNGAVFYLYLIGKYTYMKHHSPFLRLVHY